MTQQSAEDRLWRIFENVNKLLEYAEKKNGIVLVFIGFQLTFLNVLSAKIDAWLLFALIILGLCFLSTLWSFFPVTKISLLSRFYSNAFEETSNEDNLLFYEHIRKYSHKDYSDAISKYFGVDVKGQKNLEDLCAQIVENSKIAAKKFNIFKVTVFLMIAGQLLLTLSLVL